MLDFDNQKFIGYIKDIKMGLTQFAHYWSNFYCSLCDVHQ